MQLPIITRSELTDDPPAQRLDDACKDWGVFGLIDHGINPTLIAQALQEMQTFFALPAARKNQLRRTESNSWGYYDAELTKNIRDWKEILDIGEPADHGPLAGSTPQWPDLPHFKSAMQSLSDALHQVALDVVEALGRTLGTPIDLEAHFAEHSSFLRLNYYPPCPNPAAADAQGATDDAHLGISRHTDAGAVTVLLQDKQAGLQVFKDNAWHLVPVVNNGLIINIGDIVQVWSNDRYIAPEHRVLAHSDTARYSAPYFLNPAYEVNYAPLASLVDRDNQARYNPINWGHFRSQRSAGDYADQGQEIQISDFAR